MKLTFFWFHFQADFLQYLQDFYYMLNVILFTSWIDQNVIKVHNYKLVSILS